MREMEVDAPTEDAVVVFKHWLLGRFIDSDLDRDEYLDAGSGGRPLSEKMSLQIFAGGRANDHHWAGIGLDAELRVRG